MPCALPWITSLIWAFPTLGRRAVLGHVSRPWGQRAASGCVIEHPRHPKVGDCIPAARGEQPELNARRCTWFCPETASSPAPEVWQGHCWWLNELQGEKFLWVGMFFGTWVYWNSCSAGELGLLTGPLIERSFRKLNYYQMRGNVFYSSVSVS